MRTIRALAPLITSLVLAAPGVNAAPSASPFVRMSLSPGMTREAFSARADAVFTRLDADGDGFIDATDALSYARGQAARERGVNAGRLLAFDLDGDGRIDLAELSAGLRSGLALPDALGAGVGEGDPKAAAVAVLASLDRDADGRISLAEMLAIPVRETVANPVSAFLDAFPTAGGRLARGAFVQAMLDQAFDPADADRDGVISRDEFEAVIRP